MHELMIVQHENICAAIINLSISDQWQPGDVTGFNKTYSQEHHYIHQNRKLGWWFCTYAKPWWNSGYPGWPIVQSPWLQLQKSTGQKKQAWTNIKDMLHVCLSHSWPVWFLRADLSLNCDWTVYKSTVLLPLTYSR